MSEAGCQNGPPWYLTFFGEDFWAVADHEYTPERTAAETGYLAAVLDASAPGRRVLDLGCGTGRHAVALAAREFSVTGADTGAGRWGVPRPPRNRRVSGPTGCGSICCANCLGPSASSTPSSASSRSAGE